MECGTKIKTWTLKLYWPQLSPNERGKECYFFLFINYSLELMNVMETRLLLMKVRIMSKQPSGRKYPVSDKPFC